MLRLLLALAVLVSGMNRLMLRSPLGLLLTGLTGVWTTAGGAGWSVRGGKRVGLGLSAAGGGGAEDLRLDLTGLRPLGDLGVCSVWSSCSMTEAFSNPQSRQQCLSLIGQRTQKSMQRSSQNKASKTAAFQLTSSLATEDRLLSIPLLLAMQADT